MGSKDWREGTGRRIEGSDSAQPPPAAPTPSLPGVPPGPPPASLPYPGAPQNGDTPHDYAEVLHHRGRRQKTSEVIRLMGLVPGDRVADIGACSGYWAWTFSPVVGPRGKVYAVDIDDRVSIPFMQEWKRRHSFANVEVVWSRPDDVCLKPASIEHGFMCEAHFFLQQDNLGEPSLRCLKSLFRAIRPGGTLTVLEWRYNATLGGTISFQRLTEPFKQAGFTVASESSLLHDQPRAPDQPADAPTGEYLVVFRRP